VQEGQINDQTVEVILHPDRTMYSVGESIRPKLELRNHRASPIEIPAFAFDWNMLAFSSPNAAHLIAPDGQDKLLPYRRSATFTDYVSPLRVEAGQTEWLYLPISQHLHLRQFGQYIFWLELQDNFGTRHRSNQIDFQLTDIKSSLPLELLELRLLPTKSAFANDEPVEVEAVFMNKSEQPIIFLKPQEDSFDSWVNPVYQFIVLDSDEHSLALAQRSGTMGTPVYNETTQFTVAPGHSRSQNLRLPDFPRMRDPGQYRVRLTYLVRDKAIGKGGDVLDQSMNWDQRVFAGRLESNEATVNIQ
jgi:hypothetical protein